MRDKFLVFGSPRIEESEIRAVVKCLRSGWIGTGPLVSRFENDFKKYKHVKYAAALYSCTAALHLSLYSIGLKPGDEVITTPMTFCATVNSIIHAGLKPVLADIAEDTLNIDPAKIEEKITKKTRALLIVHFAGRPCNMDEIMKIVRKNKLVLIEDCAHAIESEYKHKKTGTFGEFGCFSFYVTKNIVTGEGGMVISNNKKGIERIKILGLHGMTKDAWKRFGDAGFKHYKVVECGYKANMMDMQAAIGIEQLKRIDRYWKRRKSIWEHYNSVFSGLPIGLPPRLSPEMKHSYHLYTVRIDKKKAGLTRDEFLNKMTSLNIGAGVHYLSIPEHPFYQKTFGWKPQDYPAAMDFGRQTVSLPLSAKLTDDDVEDVIKAVSKIINS